MKRILALVLTVSMFLGLGVTAFADEKPVISYWAMYTGALAENTYAETYIENKLGIELDIKRVSHTDAEAVNLMLANEMPDCGYIIKNYAFMADQELIRTIPRAMVEQYAPGIIEQMDKYPIMYAQTLDPNDPTQFLCLPDMYDTVSEMYPKAYYLRYDWILDMGIDLGDVKVEQLTDKFYIADKGLSLDVFTNILTRFVQGDPDGNGENDTYGIVRDWNSLMSAFGLISANMDYEGKATEWFVHPACKELLAYMQKIYADGLVYPEIFTIKFGQDWEMLNTGKCGVMTSGFAHYTNSWADNRPPRTWLFHNDDPSIKVLAIPGVCDANGRTLRAADIGKGFGNTNGIFYVSADVDDEKLVDILKFYNFIDFSEDLDDIATLRYGEKGVDWDWNEDHTRPVVKNLLPFGEKGVTVFGNAVQIGEEWKWITYESPFELGVKYYIKSAGGLWNKDAIDRFKYDIYNETEASAINNEFSADWSAIRNNYFMGVIMGEKNLDSDWDTYLQDLKDAHYNEYLEELDKAPSMADINAMFE